MTTKATPKQQTELEALLAQLVVEMGPDHAAYQLRRFAHGRASAEQRAAARSEYSSDVINIDEDALVSDAEEGYWVSGWLWIGGA